MLSSLGTVVAFVLITSSLHLALAPLRENLAYVGGKDPQGFNLQGLSDLFVMFWVISALTNL